MADPTLRPAIRLLPGQLRTICAARVSPDGAPVRFTGAAYDTRLLKPGELFVALPGAHTDGHWHLAEAVRRGAAALLVAAHHPALRAFSAPVPTIRVADPRSALGALAAWHRGRFAIPFVAVTGSNGKTTTKEMIAAALSPAFRVFKTPGNLNSQVGVPAALLNLAPEHTVAVCELGMSRAGEIDALARIVRPRCAVITNIAPAHLETLGTVEAVAAAKFELLSHLVPDGQAVLFADDPFLARKAGELGPRAFTYGFRSPARLVATNLRVEPDGTRFCIPSGEDVYVPLFGRHNVANALAALAVAEILGVDMLAAVAALAVMQPTRQRSAFIRAGAVTIIDDSYNSNPRAVEAALAALAEQPVQRRRVAVLGDMLELGPGAPEFHRQLAAQLAQAAPDLTVTVGELMRAVEPAAHALGLPRSRLLHFDTAADCAAMVPAWSRPGDTILIKGSRGVALETVVAALRHTYDPGHKEAS